MTKILSCKRFSNYFEEKLEYLLKDSIKSRVIADVPICTFLSSGIDSSLITSIASQTLKNTVSTFTIKFDKNIIYDKNYDESARAREIASYLNTNHTEFTITPDELIDAVEEDSNTIHEAADVFYHLAMYLEANNIKIEDVMSELDKRKK